MVASPRIIGEFDNKTQEEKVPRKKSFLASFLTLIAVAFILIGTCGININLNLGSTHTKKIPDSLGTLLIVLWLFLWPILGKIVSKDTKKSRITLLILSIIVFILLQIL